MCYRYGCSGTLKNRFGVGCTISAAQQKLKNQTSLTTLDGAYALSEGDSMSPHSRIPSVKYRRPKVRWAIYVLAVLLCLSTMGPATTFAQTLLPVVIKLPSSFLRSAPTAKLDAPAMGGVMKEMVGASGALSQIAAVRNAEVRAMELNGLLPHQFDHHYFGLEATEPGGAFAITLVVEPASVLEKNAVNFVVLTEDGMTKFVSGVDPMAIKTASGSPFLFDKVGNRLTALVPGSTETRYTVVVFNNGKDPAAYTLQVQGGVLVDNAGQSFSALKVGAPLVEAASEMAVQEAKSVVPVEETLVKFEGVVKRMGIAKPAKMISMLRELLPEAVQARQVSGALNNAQERHYLNLATDMGGDEILLTLRYESSGGAPTHLNFWVMTQDGVRHLVQGGLAQELNLATGLPVAGEPGVYQARLRMAQGMLYTVVVFSEGMTEADYTLAVQGGILMDRYGQTREAHAAEMEVLALASK
jgi:hypothetical protein